MQHPLRIAFISYEFPPETAFGGIATYVYQITKSLAALGCDVEVFSASHVKQALNQKLESGVCLHRIKVATREQFREQVAKLVVNRHSVKPFDVAESGEYGAEGIRVKQALPDVPFVVKFHTPNYLIKELNYQVKKDRLKYRLKRWMRIGRYNKEKDLELKMTLLADALVSPSTSLAKIVAEKWNLPTEKIIVLPSPFIANQAFLNIPIETQTNMVTFLGRLEVRKGVHLLAACIPGILKIMPGVTFRFIGKTNVGPKGKGTMLAYLQEQLQPYKKNIEFIEQVPMHDIPHWLGQTDICVFNSLWENFPNVCLEAMSAGRGIVASQNGGMYDMLHDIDGGLLIDPLDVAALQNALLYLLQNKEARMQMGSRSRQKVVDYYSGYLPQAHLHFYQQVAAKSKKA